MKKIFYSMLMLATAAITFTSCEDVPAPYGWPFNSGGDDTPEEVVAPAGSGTQADPYNVAMALQVCASLGADESTEEVYVKGIISQISEISTQYGNGTYYISDNGKTANQLEIYRGYGLGGERFTSGDEIKEGDEVIISGKIVNFRGTTLEFTTGSSIYSLNGQTAGSTPTPDPGTGTPSGSGTLADPYNAAAANAYIATLPADKESDKDIYVKGKIISIDDKNQFNTQYGNCTFYISDDGTENGEKFYVFRTYYLGNVKYTEGVLPKAGDEVVICGKVVNYKGNTPETSANNSYIYSLNGQTASGETPTPGGNGSGTLADPFNAAGANAYVSAMPADQTSTTDVYIKGKIISIEDKNQFNTQYGNCTFYISDDGTENGEKFYVFRTYYLGNVKYTEGVLPKAGDEVVICGKVVNYKGNTPETSANNSYIYSLNGQTASGGSQGGGGDVSGNTITVAMSSFGLENQTPLTSLTLSDGTTLTFDSGENTNPPTFYTGGGGAARLYAKNSMTINAGSKKIVKLVITTTAPSGTTKYNGNDQMYGEAGSTKVTPTKDSDTQVSFSGFNNSTLKVVNDYTEAKAGTQLRILELAITYAQ